MTTQPISVKHSGGGCYMYYPVRLLIAFGEEFESQATYIYGKMLNK